MNATERGILIGMVWGDGCIKHKKHVQKDGTISHYYEFACGHSDIQKEYIEYKVRVFHSLTGGKFPKLCQRKFFIGDKEHEEVRFSRQHKYFGVLYDWMYPFGKKTYTRRILDYMSAAGIAFWYMDDGGLSKNKNKDGKVSSVEMRISTYCSEAEADIIIGYFKDVWDIVAKKRHHKKTDRWTIAFNTTESKKLELLIKPYVCPSMMYKLPSQWVTRVRDTPSS